MQGAMDEFQKGDRGLRKIAPLWQVPKTTLARRVTGDGLSAGWQHASGKQPVLPAKVEKDLADHATIPIDPQGLQKVAYDYVTENNLSGFNHAQLTISRLFMINVIFKMF